MSWLRRKLWPCGLRAGKRPTTTNPSSSGPARTPQSPEEWIQQQADRFFRYEPERRNLFVQGMRRRMQEDPELVAAWHKVFG